MQAVIHDTAERWNSQDFASVLELWDPDQADERGVDQAELLTKLARAWYFAKGDRRALAACHEAIALLRDDDAARLSDLLVSHARQRPSRAQVRAYFDARLSFAMFILCCPTKRRQAEKRVYSGRPMDPAG